MGNGHARTQHDDAPTDGSEPLVMVTHMAGTVAVGERLYDATSLRVDNSGVYVGDRRVEPCGSASGGDSGSPVTAALERSATSSTLTTPSLSGTMAGSSSSLSSSPSMAGARNSTPGTMRRLQQYMPRDAQPGALVIHINGTVDGAIISTSAPILVTGDVVGHIKSRDGAITIDGNVHQDVMTRGGNVTVRGGTVHGAIQTVSGHVKVSSKPIKKQK